MSSLAIASCFSILIPYMGAQFGSTGVIINRVIQGLCQGFLFPSTHCVLSKWTPLAERSRIAGFVYTGEFLDIIDCNRRIFYCFLSFIIIEQEFPFGLSNFFVTLLFSTNLFKKYVYYAFNLELTRKSSSKF